MKIHLGDTINVKPYIYTSKDGQSIVNKTVRGKVIYVNKRHRFFTVEYHLAGGKLRESFKF